MRSPGKKNIGLICLLVLIFTLLHCNLVLVKAHCRPGPQYIPTKGEVWPQAQIEHKENVYYTFDPSAFKANATNHTCSILARGIHRYSYYIANLHRSTLKYARRDQSPAHYVGSDKHQGSISGLQVDLTTPCEEYPYLDMLETYNLVIDNNTAYISAGSVWGALRGLETFSQLFYAADDFTELRINKTRIADGPQYAHRGLLVDTSRHYLSTATLRALLDGMAMNKLNVLHWHLIDDQSFPYRSDKFPELSEQAAYHPSMVYTKADIQDIIFYARDRGIRVVPEFDVPGHTRSWGQAYPLVLTPCYNTVNEVIGLGPMNPIKNTTYKLLKDFFNEAEQWFPDDYLHIGGDEVELSCWQSNPDIKQYMHRNNITDVSKLHAIFMEKTIPLLAERLKPIVWQEVYDEGVPLSNKTIVQVWKSGALELVNILRSGHEALYSTSWYLDHLNNDIKSLYAPDPRKMVTDLTDDTELAKGVIGGEACMWGEMVDDTNVISRVFPRASAVAERLWSAPKSSFIPKKTFHRIEEHVCRMIRRGVPAQPSVGPGYCLS